MKDIERRRQHPFIRTLFDIGTWDEMLYKMLLSTLAPVYHGSVGIRERSMVMKYIVENREEVKKDFENVFVNSFDEDDYVILNKEIFGSGTNERPKGMKEYRLGMIFILGKCCQWCLENDELNRVEPDKI